MSTEFFEERNQLVVFLDPCCSILVFVLSRDLVHFDSKVQEESAEHDARWNTTCLFCKNY